MSHAKPPVRTPGSIAVAIVVALMFVTPVLAATTLHPLAIRWQVLFDFITAHRLEPIVGFALMIAIALMLKAAGGHSRRQGGQFGALLSDVAPRGIDGLA